MIIIIKEGKLPVHTKTSFAEYEIVTVHGIITSNALVFLHKVRNFLQLLPPTFNSYADSNIDWFNRYGFNKYRSTFSVKGPYLQ